MVKIWITGAAGRVGKKLAHSLDCMQYEVFPTDVEEVDIADIEAVRNYMSMNRPDIVINCAGLTDLEECESNPDKAYLINAIGARNLAQESNRIGAEIIQLSTDDVFGKSEEMHNEFDLPTPRSVYGKSKYAGERMVEQLNDRHVILRSSWLYGSDRDFVAMVIRKAEAGENLSLPGDEFGCPTSAQELVKVLEELIASDNYGTFHAVCKGNCSRYDFAEEVLRISGLSDRITLTKTLGEESQRPDSSVLDNMMIRITGMEEPEEWKKALEEYLMGGEKHE